MRRMIVILFGVMLLTGCATLYSPPQWNPIQDTTEAEYEPYLINGTGTITGQAFLVQNGGGVVKAAGRTVTLDPATTVGNEWWGKAGKVYVQRLQTPPSPNFLKARRSTVADADGRFKFTDLPTGKYYICTKITWTVGNYYPTEGGVIGKLIEVKSKQLTEVILNQFPE
ncbi:MAG: hypothetical protein M0Q46_04105 [Endomicrobiales bacterium]|nr:hypothetical protein [Endomicrobiales bacterium]